MSHKYEAWFCSCGRIHFHPMDDLDWMSEDHENRRVLEICRNCGHIHEQFLTESIYGDGDKPAFDVNGDDYFNDENVLIMENPNMSTNRGVSEKAYLYEYDTDADCIPIDFIKVSSGVFKCEYRFKKGTHCELKINFSSDGNIQLVSSSGDIISTPESLKELAKVLTDLNKGVLR